MTTSGRMTRVSDIHGYNVVLVSDDTNLLVLTWISVFWFSRAGPAASVRIYYEAKQSKAFSWTSESPTIPMGVSSFRNDIVLMPLS